MTKPHDAAKADWDAFRRQMPVAERWVYLDHAAVGPLPLPARDAISKWLEEATFDGATQWLEWSKRLGEVRTLAADLIGAGDDEIALVHNTTTGISLVAEGYPWQTGDNVVTLANEFPSNLYPWMNLASRGVETRFVEAPDGRVDLDRLADACDERTRIVAISWIGFARGYRSDVRQLAQLAHDRGALLFLDAIQGMGVFPLDVREANVDFLAADGHKWMLGPEGAGFLFVNREHLDLLRPIGVGWNSVRRAKDYDHIELDLKPTAARYEGGSENMAGFIGLGASLELLASYGPKALGQRILQITEFACQALQDAGATIKSIREGDKRSGIVAFHWPTGEMAALRHQMRDKKIVLSYRGGCLRISPHAYTTEGDIEQFVGSLQELGG